MSAPRVKGWCPSAYRPMMSGDGLLVRVRPRLARLSAAELSALCAASERFGNGLIDVTSRGNLQIRGVAEDQHDALTTELASNGLIDHNATLEQRRAVLTTPLWKDGDLTARLHAALLTRLGDFPELPDKMGLAIDAGTAPVLTSVSADFRFERAPDGHSLLLCADGASHGCPVTETNAVDALLDMMDWFCATQGPAAGRLAKHLANSVLPAEWRTEPRSQHASAIAVGPSKLGHVYGVPFGTVTAANLRALVLQSDCAAVRITPWRSVILEGCDHPMDVDGFLSMPDARLQAFACIGSPGCGQAKQPTRALAEQLAKSLPCGTTVHVSGCAKGCARREAADLTFVGSDQGYDLVTAGHAWDEPERRSLTAVDILKNWAG